MVFSHFKHLTFALCSFPDLLRVRRNTVNKLLTLFTMALASYSSKEAALLASAIH